MAQIRLYPDAVNTTPPNPQIRLYPTASDTTTQTTKPQIRLYPDTNSASTQPFSSGATFSGVGSNGQVTVNGNPYGASNITDASSGKPLLTYADQKNQRSVLLSDRTALPFDITKPQKIDAKVVYNKRMSDSVRNAIKVALPGSAFKELDHIMPLELGGSNNKSNLQLESGKNPNKPYSASSNPTATDPIENKLKWDMVSGKISVLDGWKQIAALKGFTLPEDGGPIPKMNQMPSPPQSYLGKVGSGLSNAAYNLTHPFAIKSGEEFVQKFPQLAQSLADLQENPLALGTSLEDLVKTPYHDVLEASDAFNASVATFLRALKTNAPASEKVADGLRMATTFVGGTLTPITTWFNVAGKIPIVGSVSKLIFNVPFSVLGDVSGDTGVAILNSLNISQEAKDHLEGAVRAASSLAGQIVAGGKIAPDIIKPMTDALGSESAQAIFSKAKEMAADQKGFIRISHDGKEAQFPDASVNEGGLTDFEKNASVREEANKNLPEIQVDDQAKNEAVVKTIVGKGKRLKALDKPTQDAYRAWVNHGSHDTQALSGRIASNAFEDLRSQKMTAVDRFQNGYREGRLADVHDFMQNLLKKEQDAGIPVDERANYLPQYWRDSQAEVQKAYDRYLMKKRGETSGKAVSLRPGFTKEVIFPSYAEGRAAGLTPRYDNIPDMINERVRSSEKALADRKFYDYLAKNNLIQPGNDVSTGWKALDAERFPKYSVRLSDGVIYHGNMSAPEGLADLINNQIKAPESFGDRFFQKTALVASKLKNIALSAGIPGTAINLHGFNELAATVPEVFNQPSLFSSALKYLIYPKAGGEFVKANLELAREASRSGLTISVEDHAFDELGKMKIEAKGLRNAAGKVINKGSRTLYNLFGRHDFEEMIPALKLKMWSDLQKTLIAKGFNATEAGRKASAKANSVFGGINYADLGRDKSLQNILRTFVFAPDFWESRLRYAGKLGESLWKSDDPLASKYRTSVATIIGAYIGMNLWNKQSLGRFMFQNPAGHQMDVFMGHDKFGKDIWIRPFGTSMDFIRLPIDIMDAAANGDLSTFSAILRNRVSSLLQPIVGFVANKDQFGNPIFGPDKYGKPQSVGSQTKSFAATLPVVPQVASGLAELANPNQSKLQSISQAISLPLRFNAPANNQDIQNLKDKAAEAVRNGDYGPLNELIKNKVIPATSRNSFIKNARMTDAQKQAKKDKSKKQSQKKRAGAANILGL